MHTIDANFADTFKGDNNLSTQIIFQLFQILIIQSFGNVSYLINATGIGKTDILIYNTILSRFIGTMGGNKTTKEFISFSRLVIKTMFDKRDGLIEFITDLSKRQTRL